MRYLDSGEERSFDPQSGGRCNLLSFGATDEHVVMGQYCGTARTPAAPWRPATSRGTSR